MALHVVRGRKSPFQRNMSLSVANYFSSEMKQDIVEVLDKYSSYDQSGFYDDLESPTVST